MSPHGKQAGKTILTAGSEEERVIIAFIFNGRKRDNLYKVICFKFHIQERLRFHSLKGNKNTRDVTEKSPTPSTYMRELRSALTVTQTQF